jgi:hypothetical protein
VFSEEEQPQLQKVPRERFDLPVWKEARVHPDHHVVFLKSYYSLPTRYIGKKVWVRGGLDTVRVFCDGELIKTHQRSYRPGSFKTDERDYPPEKSKYVLKTNSYYQREALQYGGYVCQVVRRVMRENAYRNLRKVQGIFRLADTYGSEALNLTCKRCLFYGDYRMSTIKRILTKKLYELPFDDEGTVQTLKSSAEGLSFIRSPHYFIHKEEVLS